MTRTEILNHLPFATPYRFIDEILEVDDESLRAAYRFREDEFFYRGHFPGRPITPGAILGEAASQAVLALGIYLVREDESAFQQVIFLTSSDLRFKKIVLPGHKISINVKKQYFRFGKLKCVIRMTNEGGEMICRGTISGILTPDDYEQGQENSNHRNGSGRS